MRGSSRDHDEVTSDESQLRKAIVKAGRAAFTALQKNHPSEHFYAFIFYTAPELGYLVPSSATEEALTRLASDPREQEDLRWSPCDWEYHLSGEAHFNEVNELLEADRVESARSEAERQERFDRRWSVFKQAILQLDEEGVFGTGDARAGVLVNIMWGDQDVVAHLQSARELNPKSTYLAYAKAELPTLKAWLEEIRSSNSLHKTESLRRIEAELSLLERDLS